MPKRLTNGGGSGTIKASNEQSFPLQITDKQKGKKIGKHASDFGLNPSKQEDRLKVEQLIRDIVQNHDEAIRIGKWRGHDDEVLFFIKQGNVVITKQNGEFVTILKGGIDNGRVKNAREFKV